MPMTSSATSTAPRSILNEQGRTETWTNSIPRYLMLHVAYKLTLGMAASKKDNVWDSGEL